MQNATHGNTAPPSPVARTNANPTPKPKPKPKPQKPHNHHSFRQALLLDCDVQLARDPSYLFESEEFEESGALLWGDIYSEGLVKPEAAEYVGE